MTYGSLFAGIGGFDIGFEKAGWQGLWQVEIDPINRAVLADRFPGTLQLSDVRNAGARNLSPVDCLAFGSPCTNLSAMGTCTERKGFDGPESGLFREALRIIDEIRPAWVVFENVPGLLNSRSGKDAQILISEFAKRNYLGFARVLDAQYFGVPQGRRRLFLVAGLGCYPPMEFLADAGSVESLRRSLGEEPERVGDFWLAYTLTAPPREKGCRINLCAETLVAEPDAWSEMVKRERTSQAHGFCLGLDASSAAEAFSAGNAVCPAIAYWIARILGGAK